MRVTDQVMRIGRLSPLTRAMTRILREIASAKPRRSGKNGDAARRRLLSRCAHSPLVSYFIADGHV